MLRARDLSLDEAIGQLLWIGFAGTSLDADLETLIRTVHPGGFILFGRNIETAVQVRSLNDALHRAVRVPPFIALDQEGGRVNRLRSILGPSPPALTLAAASDPTGAVRRHAGAVAAALRCLGFNVNFAPVLDLSGPDPANGIGDRAFGEDPDLVAGLARACLSAHEAAGVLTVGKHFPGLGSARADTHVALPAIRRTRRLLWREDLLPYRRLRTVLPMVMVGHAHYPALQGARPQPATLSRPVVEGLLRRRLAFRGLILTDDLEMGAIDQGQDGARQAIAALEAGSDGLMFSRSADRIREAHAGLRQAVGEGRIGRDRLARSLRRILRLKERAFPRRRPRFSAGSLARARLAIESLGAGADAGFDPTARA